MIDRIVCRPFIGRDDELAFLHAQRLALNAGRGGIVLIAGEAGIGKSRLLAEFARNLKKSRTRISVGQCLEFAQRPYGPVLDVLARLDPNGAADLAAHSQVEHVEALAERFKRITNRFAAIVIFEDLHWADAATLEFLAYLASKIDEMRLLMIGTYRPEHLEDGASGPLGYVARARRFAQIDLHPLDGPELRRFIDEALHGIELAANTRRAVARTSEGNPFFTEELLKSAVEQQASPHTLGRSRRLSQSVRAIVLERLQPLDEASRAVLAHAAVIGRDFDVTLLCETLAESRPAVLATLQHARELQLVDEETDERFRFRHALTREAIYDQFLQAQVRPLHRTIALALEARAAESRPIEPLAYHWWAAGDREHGSYFNERAGDAAGAVFAHDNAIAAYERALQLSAEGSPEAAALLAKIGRHRASLGSHRIAMTTLAAAADILRECADFDGEAALRIAASQSAHLAGISDPCAPLERSLERLPGDARRARSVIRLQLAWHEAGIRFRVDVAARHLADIDRDTVFADDDLRRTYHSVSALIHCLSGNVPGLRAEAAKALEADRTQARTDRSIWTEINTAMEFACLDLREEARVYFARARHDAVMQNSRNLEAHVAAMSASMLFVEGDLAGVRRNIDAATALRIDSAIIRGHCAAWGTLAGLALGDDALIDAWFDDSGIIHERTEIEYFAAGYAEILHRRGRTTEARALLHHAIAGGTIRRGVIDTFIAIARFGDDADIGRARELLVACTVAAVDVLEQPGLALFDAHVARRAGDHAAASARARDAAAGFARRRAPLLEAAAHVLARNESAAIAIYQRLGATGCLQQLAAYADPQGPQARKPLHNGIISRRESDVAALVATGAANLEIAERLSISLKTVEKHVSAIYQKLGFSTRAQLATWVVRSSHGET